MSGRLIFAGIMIITLVLIYYYWPARKAVLSKVDNKKYNVLKYENAQEAADMLARLNKNMLSFLLHLRNKYHIDETDEVIREEGQYHGRVTGMGNGELYLLVDSVLDGYNTDTLYENNPRNISGDTSYTLSKGKSLYMCLRDKKDPNRLIDYNSLMFVFLHEISHISNYDGWGHDTRFWEVFKFILNEAVEYGIYRSVNYRVYSVNYCGLTIDYNPLFDEGVAKIW